MQKRNKKKTNKFLAFLKSVKLNNISILVLLVSYATLSTIFVVRQYSNKRVVREAKNVLSSFQALTDIEGHDITYESAEVKIGRFKVIGSIKIESIGLEYPILEDTTTKSLKLSITKLYGPDLNELGNVSLAGHNTRNGGLFSKLPNVKTGDIIEITDRNNNTVKYEIYETFIVKPTDTSSLNTANPDVRELTLVTCVQGGKNRLIVKASEVIEQA